MSHPTIYTLRGLLDTANGPVSSSNDGKNYVPARPMGSSICNSRIKAAWLVFTGRAHAVVWPQGQ